MNKKFIGFLLLVLSACSENKVKLEGDRQSFITVNNDVKNDSKNDSVEVRIDPSFDNKNWEYESYNQFNNPKPFSISKDLKKIWSQSIGEGSSKFHKLIGGLLVSNGFVYAVDSKGLVSARNLKDGKLVWSFNTTPNNQDQDNAMGGKLGINNNIVYVCTAFGEVIALDSKEGKQIWRSFLETPIRSAAIFYEEKIFITAINNEIICLNASNGQKIWGHGGLLEPSMLLGTSCPAIYKDLVLATFASGEIYALQNVNGQVIWSDTIPPAIKILSVSSIPHIKANPVVNHDVVYVVSHGGRMVAMDLKQGQKIWQKDLGGINTPFVNGDFIFVLTGLNDLVCLLKKDGSVKWSIKMPKGKEEDQDVMWSGPIVANDNLVLTSSDGRVGFFSIKDGNLVKTLNFDDSAMLPPIVADGTLLVLGESGTIHAWR